MSESVESTINSEWQDVIRGSFIEYDLETTPLEIKASSAIGSNELINLKLYGSEERDAGSVRIALSNPPQIKIVKCVDSIPTSSDISTASTNLFVWKITKTVGPGLKIEAGSVTVVDVMLTQDVCSDYKTDWYLYWHRAVTKIKFLTSDTASSQYSSTSGKRKLSVLYFTFTMFPLNMIRSVLHNTTL